MLFHTRYQRRDGSIAALTFFAADLISQLEFEKIWAKTAGVKILDSRAVGSSRFVNKGGRTVLREGAKT